MTKRRPTTGINNPRHRHCLYNPHMNLDPGTSLVQPHSTGQAIVNIDLNLESMNPGQSEQPCAIDIQGLTHVYPTPKKTTKPRSRQSTGTSKPKNATAMSASGQRALDDVSFEVRQGEIFGVLGPNGGGKTTLFRILSTLLRPSQGCVRIADYDLATQSRLVRQQLGVVFQMPSLDVKLSAWENLQHQGHLYGLQGADLRQRISRLLETVGLSDQRDDRVESFSGGMRRRVELAKALLHAPPLLLLDEPSTGLDVAARRDLWRYLEALCSGQGTTVVLTTHLMDEADRCDRLAILSEGKLVAIDTPINLKARIGGDVLTIETAAEHADGLRQDITARFGPWPQGTEPIVIDGKVRLEKTDGAGFVAMLTEAFSDRINSITVGRPTLEDVFMNLTGHTL